MHMIMFLILLGVVGYILPIMVAKYKKHPNIAQIVKLNVLLGWVIALVMACVPQKKL